MLLSSAAQPFLQLSSLAPQRYCEDYEKWICGAGDLLLSLSCKNSRSPGPRQLVRNISGQAAARGMTVSVRLGCRGRLSARFAAFAVYRDLYMRSNFAVQFHRNMKLAEALERIVQMHLAAIDLESLRFQSGGNIRRSN